MLLVKAMMQRAMIVLTTSVPDRDGTRRPEKNAAGRKEALPGKYSASTTGMLRACFTNTCNCDGTGRKSVFQNSHGRKIITILL